MRYKYILEQYKGMRSRYVCPSCNTGGVFTRYIDTTTGKYIHPSVGRCSRSNKCDYHYPPKQYFKDNGIPISSSIRDFNQTQSDNSKPTSFIPNDIFQESLLNELDIWQIANQNNFVSSLIGTFKGYTEKLVKDYFVGTSNHWHGTTIFWQVDLSGKIRTGKIMLYGKLTGKRIKEPYDHFSWIHNRINQPNFGLRQCLFGEHLLKDTTKPVAMVESEKTAVIASGYMPEFIWVATGGLHGLTEEKCRVLKNRKVILFPDLGKGFTEWSKKAKELSHITHFQVSTLLERKATDDDRSKGLDLADYLGRLDYLEFALYEEPTHQAEPPAEVKALVEGKRLEQTEPIDCNEELKQHHKTTGMIEDINDE